MYPAGGVLAHPTLAEGIGPVNTRHQCGIRAQPAFPRWQKRRPFPVRAKVSRVEQAKYSQSKPWQERALAGIFGAAAAASIALAGPAQAEVQPFLSSTGAKGIIADEEARLVRLRQEIEGEARDELQRARESLEAEGRNSASGKLCATPFGIDVVGISQVVFLTGALVGGVAARQRKAELERLNEQLRKINMSLRQQARAGTVYAPGLNYAPIPMPASPFKAGGAPVLEGQRIKTINGVQTPVQPEVERVGETIAAPSSALSTSSVMGSTDEEDMTQEAKQCVQALREGKRLLKERQGSSALVRFERALMLAKYLGDLCQERRATRGLAAAARLQGQHKAAIQHLLRVLEISKEMNDFVGDADAYGTIADIYTEMGNFDTAAQYYDRYIERMDTEGSAV